jgi:hypothetical protein
MVRYRIKHEGLSLTFREDGFILFKDLEYAADQKFPHRSKAALSTCASNVKEALEPGTAVVEVAGADVFVHPSVAVHFLSDVDSTLGCRALELILNQRDPDRLTHVQRAHFTADGDDRHAVSAPPGFLNDLFLEIANATARQDD